jgi:hypothetical protein
MHSFGSVVSVVALQSSSRQARVVVVELAVDEYNSEFKTK